MAELGGLADGTGDAGGRVDVDGATGPADGEAPIDEFALGLGLGLGPGANEPETIQPSTSAATIPARTRMSSPTGCRRVASCIRGRF